LKVDEERKRWARDFSQQYAEALGTNPGVAANLAKQFAIALLIVSEPGSSASHGAHEVAKRDEEEVRK
jgi:hypothetical protein